MLIINTVTLLCLAVFALEILGFFISILAKSRAERISFLRGFKKGKCAIVFITAIPLYMAGHTYGGQSVFNSFFTAINKIINLVVLKYDFSSISALMEVNALYRLTVYVCFLLVGANALIFTLSISGQYVWTGIQRLKERLSLKEKLYLFGYNKENLTIYATEKERCKNIVDDLDSSACLKLYSEKISFLCEEDFGRIIERICKESTKSKKRRIVVVNMQKDDKNIKICRMFIERIASSTDEEQKRIFETLRVYVFGNPDYESIYQDLMTDGFGCIDYVNKYQKIAIDFIDRYPFTGFMDGKQIDFKTSLVKKDVRINAFLIGFGKTNQQIFLTSVANNQFLTGSEDEPTLLPVRYFIFDKEKSENNKNLNHTYYTYKNNVGEYDQKEYLPLPELPAEESYYHLNVNSCDFYKVIQSEVCRNTYDANFVVIAYGNDLENIDMAKKLLQKRDEWGAKRMVVFVKVRAWRKEETILAGEECFFIGNEKDAVFNIKHIANDVFTRRSHKRNAVYDLERALTDEPTTVVTEEFLQKCYENVKRKWYLKKTPLERESNLYGCLSLRSKLNLMGLDYKPIEEGGNALTETEYLKIYAGNDLPDVSKYTITANGKKIVSYGLKLKTSRRKTMAIHEHHRWNAFMLSKGLVPATIEQILSETELQDGAVSFTNGKNYRVRRHGNLTTFEGLIEFRRMVAERDGCSEAEKDVIKYDYQLLDDAYWLLTDGGYKIVPFTPYFKD